MIKTQKNTFFMSVLVISQTSYFKIGSLSMQAFHLAIQIISVYSSHIFRPLNLICAQKVVQFDKCCTFSTQPECSPGTNLTQNRQCLPFWKGFSRLTRYNVTFYPKFKSLFYRYSCKYL